MKINQKYSICFSFGLLYVVFITDNSFHVWVTGNYPTWVIDELGIVVEINAI